VETRSWSKGSPQAEAGEGLPFPLFRSVNDYLLHPSLPAYKMAYNPSQSTSSSSWWQPQQPSAQSQQPLSAYSTNARQSTWGTQSQLGEDTMEDVTSKGGDYLPGYLTNASYGRVSPVARRARARGEVADPFTFSFASSDEPLLAFP
jgi:hypothetical protein